MLAYILGITKRSSRRIANQLSSVLGTTNQNEKDSNRGSLRDFK